MAIPSNLVTELAAHLPDITLEKVSGIGLDHARENLPHCFRSLASMKDDLKDVDTSSAIVIAAGPSLHQNDVAARIREANFGGVLIATESAMWYCLRNELVPHVIVTLDPDQKRIVRFFGDPELTEDDLELDDYFRRQDLDPEFQKNEMKRNVELLELVDQFGPRIKAAVATCAPSSVVKRCIESGMKNYWWNPFYDNVEEPESLTRQVFKLNGLPCMNAGGNVGTACWVIAHSFLGAERVALTGMDLSYYDDTELYQTQYYYELLDLVGEERIAEAFIHIENPYLNRSWFTDPTYYWYKEVFLEMAADAPCRTYNCTEGGILFGEGVEFVSLDAFLGDSADELRKGSQVS